MIDHPLCKHGPRVVVTCGSCTRQWCELCDGTHGPLCHYCHGRGYSTAPRGVAIRFNEWTTGGGVTLTISPGQTLSHYAGGPTEEGYSYTGRSWQYDGVTLSYRSLWESKDCDGRTDSYAEFHARAIKPDGYPDWQEGEAGQRDYSAEAMGY